MMLSAKIQRTRIHKALYQLYRRGEQAAPDVTVLESGGTFSLRLNPYTDIQWGMSGRPSWRYPEVTIAVPAGASVPEIRNLILGTRRLTRLTV
jgi:hypothetical protein